MKIFKGIIIGLSFTALIAYGATILSVPQGGTGTNTLVGCLTGNGILPIISNGSPCPGFPFNVTNYNGNIAVSTSTTVWFQTNPFYSLIASSSLIEYASTTSITARNVISQDGVFIGPGAYPASPQYALNVEGQTRLDGYTQIFQLEVTTDTILHNLQGAGLTDCLYGQYLTWTNALFGCSAPFFTYPSPGTSATTSNIEITSGNADALAVLSGNAGANTSMAIGRTAAEGRIAIAGGANQYAVGALTGDIIVRNDSSTGNLILGTNGIGTMFLNNNNVGIGTTTPFTTLDVNTASSTAGTDQKNPFGELIEMTINGIWYMVESFDYYGHLITSGPTPTLSSCGTNPTIQGNDRNMRVYEGTAAGTSCQINFAYKYVNPPICVVNQETGTAATLEASSTPTIVVVTGAGVLSSDAFTLHCEGYQ